MTRAALTASYLDQVRERGVSAAELVGDLAESQAVLLNSFFPGLQYLSRPIFVGHREAARLHADVETVRSVLVSLPDRLYEGDFTAFARDAGAEGYEITAVAASRSSPVSPQARADLYQDASGFRLMEFNMGSALGGMENGDLCRAMLRHPLLAEFAAAHRLGYVDTMREQVTNMLTATGLAPGSAPVVAVTDWPSSYDRRLGPYMHELARRWREFGLDAHGCHMGELEVRGGRVWLAGRAVDIISRMFLLEYLLEPGAADLMDPVLGAAARGEVAMFTPLDSELFGSKAALAMLSDQRNRHLFTAAELASLDRILPWTRMVRPGPVTLEDGQTVDLLDYALRSQDDLVLKPTLRYGGQDVLPGWHQQTSPGLWRDRLVSALDGPFVIQRRIRPVPELFPGERAADRDHQDQAAGHRSELVPWIVAWGLYTGASGFGGIITGPARSSRGWRSSTRAAARMSAAACRPGRTQAEETVMTDRATLTARYLGELTRSGARASELLGSLPESDLLDSLYQQRYLPRPVFLGHAEREQLHQDLQTLGAALLSLPDRLYGGDTAAFARAVGMTDVQVSAVLQSQSPRATRLTRADIYADQSGFRVLEFNIGSPVGGIDNADLCRGLLEHSLLAEFARAHRLCYVDTMRGQVDTILGETGTGARLVSRWSRWLTGRITTGDSGPTWASWPCAGASWGWMPIPATSGSSRCAPAGSGSAAGRWTSSSGSS